MYGPYLPHVTESLYQALYKKTEGIGSLHQTKFKAVQTPYDFAKNAELMNLIIKIVGTIRKLKTEKELSLKVPLVTITFYADNTNVFEQLKTQEQLLRGVTHAQAFDYKVAQKGENKLEEKDGEWSAHINL